MQSTVAKALTVIAGGGTGLSVAGEWGGIAAAIATAIGVAITLRQANRTQHERYDAELRQARADERADADREFSIQRAQMQGEIVRLTDLLAETRTERDHLRRLNDRTDRDERGR